MISALVNRRSVTGAPLSPLFTSETTSKRRSSNSLQEISLASLEALVANQSHAYEDLIKSALGIFDPVSAQHQFS